MSGVNLAPGETRIDRIVQAVRYIMQGRNNACGEITLAASTTITTVAAPNCASGAKVFLESTTVDAAMERSGGNLYISSVANGQFNVTHSNNSQTDRTFFWTALG